MALATGDKAKNYKRIMIEWQERKVRRYRIKSADGAIGFRYEILQFSL